MTRRADGVATSRRIRLPILLGVAATALSCSRTVPESEYPPPAPRDGLPYIPFPEENPFLEGDEPGDSAPAADASAAKRPSSVPADLPAAPSLALDRKSACSKPKCELRAWLPDPAFAKSVPGGEPTNAALWAQELAAGSTLVFPRHHGFDVLAVVISGSALAIADDGGVARKLAVWDALRAPGAGISVKADAGGAKLLFAIASGKTTIDEALERAKAKPWEVRWKKRASGVAVARLTDVADLEWAGGAFHARIAFGGEYTLPASFGTLLASDDAAVPEHDHPTWEHIVIVEGSGTFRLGGEKHDVKPGSLFQIKSGVRHAFAPAGDSKLVAIQLYAPSGPEQRFVKLAAEAKASAAKAPAAGGGEKPAKN